jgi:hypothetical protein
MIWVKKYDGRILGGRQTAATAGERFEGQQLPHDFIYTLVIILGEFGIAIALALLARTLRRGSWRQTVIAGIGGGFSIFICYALAFWVTDRLFG